MAQYQYERVLRQIEEDEKRRKEQESRSGWDKFSSGVGSAAKGVGDFLSGVPGFVGGAVKGTPGFVSDVAQGIPRGLANISLTIAEGSRNMDIDKRNENIDRVLSINKDRREKLLKDFQDPEKSKELSDKEWADALVISRAQKQFGSLDEDHLKRLKKINDETKNEHLTYKADNGFMKFLVGGEEDEVAQSAQKTDADVTKWGVDQGLSESQAGTLGFAAAAGLTALDAPTGLGSLAKGTAAKAIGKSGIKQLAKETSPDIIRETIRKALPGASDDAIEALVPRLAAANKDRAVRNILKDADDLMKNTAKASDDVFNPNELSERASNSLLKKPDEKFMKPDRLNGAKYSYQEVDTGLTQTGKDLDGRIAFGKNDNGDIIIKDGTHLLEAYRDRGIDIPTRKVRFEDGVTADDLRGVVPDGKPPMTRYAGEEDMDAVDAILGRVKTSAELDSRKKGTWQNMKEQFYDKLSPINEMVSAIEQRTGKKLATEDNPYELMRLYQGMPDMVQQRVSELTNILKEAPDLDAVKTIGLARQIRSRSQRGIKSFVDDETANRAVQQWYNKLGQADFDKAQAVVQAVQKYNRGLLDDLHQSGIISDDALRAIEDTGADYFARFNVIDYIMKSDTNRALFSKTGSYNTTKQTLNKILAGAKGMEEGTEILDPVESIVKSTDATMRAVAKNEIWHTFNRLADEAPDLIVRVRDPEKVAERIGLSLMNKELRPVRNRLDKVIKSRGATVRRLESQINKLEKKGLSLSLKKGGQRMDSTPFNVGGLGGDVATSKAGQPLPGAMKQAIDNEIYDAAPGLFNEGYFGRALGEGGSDKIPRIHVDDLKFYGFEENIPNTYKRRTGKRDADTLAQSAGFDDVTDFLEAITSELDARRAMRESAKDISNLRRDPAIIRAAGKNVETFPNKLGPADTGAFLRNLIENGSRSDIDKIKKMVGTRDVKLTQLLDDIGEMKSQYDDIAGTIRANTDKARSLADQEVPEGMALISGFGEGIQGKLAVPEEIADVFTGKTKAQRDYLTSLMTTINSFVKQNFTSNNIAFALFTNPARDFKSFAMNSRNVGAGPHSILKAYSKGLFGRVMRDADYKQMIEAGGKSGFYADERTAERLARDLTRTVSGKRVLGVKVAPVNTPGEFIKEYSRILTAPLRTGRDALHGAASILEDAPRLAEFKAGVQSGKTARQAAFDARNVTVDFQQSGTVGQVLNAWIPFLNARLQGNLKTAQAIKNNPARALSVYATMSATPIWATMANNMRFPEVMNNITDDERDNNFILVLGDKQDEDGNYTQVIKIPKSEVDKIFGNPMEQLARFVYDNDPDTFAETITNMIGNSLPFDTVRDDKFNLERTVGGITPPLLKAPLESVTNRNLYFGSDIVPESLQDFPNAEQVKPNTSEAAKFLAGLTGASPLKTENTLRSFTGNLLTKNPQDQLTGRLTGASSNRMNDEFYSTLDTTRKNRASASKYINEAIGRGDIAAAQQAAQTYNQYLIEAFTPFADRYGAQMTADLADIYDEQKIILTKRSVKQRQRNQLERQALGQ